MGANDLQDDYDRLKPKTLASVGKLLGRRGEPFDGMLNGWLLETRELVADAPEFAVWMAEALVWARFAERADDFFGAAAGFIPEGDPELLDEAALRIPT